VPHAWHSVQRPTHLAVSQPHSVQWYAAGLALLLAMVRTYVPTPTSCSRLGETAALSMI
jgi:hypothetical protein